MAYTLPDKIVDEIRRWREETRESLDLLDARVKTLEENTIEKLVAVDAYRAGMTPSEYLVQAFLHYQTCERAREGR